MHRQIEAIAEHEEKGAKVDFLFQVLLSARYAVAVARLTWAALACPGCGMRTWHVTSGAPRTGAWADDW